MEKFVIVSWCLVGLVASVYSAAVPPYIKVCHRRDPHLNECAKKSVLGLREQLRKGMPELKVPPLEPLIIEDPLTLADSESFSASTKNIKIFGIPAIDDLDVNADLENKKIDIDVRFNSLKIEGDYDIKARILVPITAQGPIQIDAKDVRAKILLKFKIVQHKGRDHLYFTSTTCKLTIGDYTSHFVPRPGEDQTFSTAINEVLNSSKKEILAGIVNGLERGVAHKVVNVANLITKNFSYDELLPDTL